MRGCRLVLGKEHNLLEIWMVWRWVTIEIDTGQPASLPPLSKQR